MYQALYRKWRPRVFEDVVGQPNIVKTLENEVKNGRIGHAYIFTGSRGTGKTTCAKILSKAVNCLNPHDGNPCNECENCKGIDNGSLLDVVEIDAASNNGVDSIRDLREETIYSPASAKYRVYIIDEAHMLTPGAFNALLKTLEEPPSYVIFILATTEIAKIPETILSRCQRFDFQRIPQKDIINRLNYVAEQEKIELEPAAASMIAKLCDGAMRNALSLLDQCSSDKIVNEEKVAIAAGLTDRKYLFEISDSVINKNPANALKVIDSLYKMSKDMEKLCQELISHFRDIMVVKSLESPFDIVTCTTEEKQKLEDSAKAFSNEELLHAIDTLEETLIALKRNIVQRVTIETCILRLCNPYIDTSKSALLRRIEELEDKLSSGNFVVGNTSFEKPVNSIKDKTTIEQQKTELNSNLKTTEAPTKSTKVKNEVAEEKVSDNPTKKETPKVETSKKSTAETDPTFQFDDSKDGEFTCWQEVIDAVHEHEPSLSGFLKGAKATIVKEYVEVRSDNPFFADFASQKQNQLIILAGIRKATKKPYKLRIPTDQLKKDSQGSTNEKNLDSIDEILDNAKNLGIDVAEKN